ncbi:MAG: hypothetical protein BGO40_05755 [Chryseobacterium sp. 39-10]|nr:MAG: hypothetical protein BGO40_05755 [Chryseobacterium sp. 39-10]
MFSIISFQQCKATANNTPKSIGERRFGSWLKAIREKKLWGREAVDNFPFDYFGDPVLFKTAGCN